MRVGGGDEGRLSRSGTLAALVCLKIQQDAVTAEGVLGRGRSQLFCRTLLVSLFHLM